MYRGSAAQAQHLIQQAYNPRSLTEKENDEGEKTSLNVCGCVRVSVHTHTPNAFTYTYKLHIY